MGFSLTCIKCGEAGSIKLDLTDLDTVTCSECEAEYSLDEVREVLKEWTPVLSWIESAEGYLPANSGPVVTARYADAMLKARKT